MAASTMCVVALLSVLGAGAAPFEVNTLHGGAVSKFSKGDSGTYGTVQTKQRPVSMVVNMLKDMQAQLAKEQDEDQAAYDKFACWCESNDKTKTKSIADAEKKIKDLTATVEELTASGQQLTTEVAGLEGSIKKGEHALSEATAVRDKELAEFNQQDKDAIAAITGLHGAVETLSKHNGAALLQQPMLQIRKVLAQYATPAQLRKLGLAPKARRAVASLLQQAPPAFAQAGAGGDSGEIFGVLTSMKESFETNMKSARTEEEQSAAEFAQLKKAKTTELEAAEKQLDAKSAEHAKAHEDLANSKIDLKDTTAELKENRVFLGDLKKKCSAMDKEWAQRVAMRQDENTALSQALEIITDDDARDTMAKTTGFFQVATVSSRQANAAKFLEGAAKRLSKPKLSMLAMKLKSGVFDKAIENVKAMIEQLHKDQKEEVQHKDYCIEELHQSEMTTDKLYHTKSSLETKQADLEALIQRLQDEIAGAKADIADMQISMKKAGEARAAESKDFTDIIAEQREMQHILGKAVAKLRAFYDRKASLLQTTQEPAGFQPYKKGGGGMVIATLEHLIKDSHNVQIDSTSQNNNAQRAYEGFMTEQNKAVILQRQQIVDQTEQLAGADADLTRAKADLVQNMKDLEGQDSMNNAVHSECDFLLKNFDQRQQAITDEVDALYEAISMMSNGGGGAPPAEAAPAPAL